MKPTIASAIVYLVIVNACAAPNPGRSDTTSPATTTPIISISEEPGESDSSVSRIDEILDRIEAKSNQIKTLQAKIRYDRIQGLLGDEQRRFGSLVYQAGPPARFSIHFDRLIVDDTVRMQNRRYVFDGHWLTEKLDDQKIYIRRQLVDENENADLIKLGEGPFALPLNQKKEEILNRFDVTIMDDNIENEDEEYPANCLHLLLKPREELDIKPTRIELWYDRESYLPKRAASIDEKEESESIIDILNLQENIDVDPRVFQSIPPTEPGWQIEVKPLEDSQ